LRTLALVVPRTSSIVGSFEDVARPKIDLFGLVGPASVSGNVDAGLVSRSRAEFVRRFHCGDRGSGFARAKCRVSGAFLDSLAGPGARAVPKSDWFSAPESRAEAY
jgi:hypothetical protein